MLEILAYNINGIPLTFWGFMVALILAMHCMARTSLKQQQNDLDSTNAAVALAQTNSDVVNR